MKGRLCLIKRVEGRTQISIQFERTYRGKNTIMAKGRTEKYWPYEGKNRKLMAL